MGAQSSLPVDAAGNPWLGNYMYDHGNLVSNLLDNVVLESTGVLQKTRIYEMSNNKAFRETLAFLIVRDNAHQNAFAKALETLGVNWGKVFPVPNYDINKYPECQKYVDLGFHNAQFNFWTTHESLKYSAVKHLVVMAASFKSRNLLRDSHSLICLIFQMSIVQVCMI